MEYTELLGHYGSISAVARALNIKAPSIHGWKKRNKVPFMRQQQVERLTNGVLKADPLPVPHE